VREGECDFLCFLLYLLNIFCFKSKRTNKKYQHASQVLKCSMPGNNKDFYYVSGHPTFLSTQRFPGHISKQNSTKGC